MQVSQAETSVPGFERHTLKCSACPQIARRLVSSHPKPPVANLPAVVTHPEPPASKLRTERAAAPRTWAKVSEKLRNRQTPTEKKSEAARSSAWADAVEKLRRRQAALKDGASIPSRSQPAELCKDRRKLGAVLRRPEPLKSPRHVRTRGSARLPRFARGTTGARKSLTRESFPDIPAARINRPIRHVIALRIAVTRSERVDLEKTEAPLEGAGLCLAA
jgi:hypothetical protein